MLISSYYGMASWLSNGRRISMLDADWGPSPYHQLCLVARLSNGQENIDAGRQLGALLLLSIAFGSKAIKWSENIDARRRLGALPFRQLRSVARLSNDWRISMLDTDWEPSPYCQLRSVTRLSNGWREYRCSTPTGGPPLPSIAFGSKAIK